MPSDRELDQTVLAGVAAVVGARDTVEQDPRATIEPRRATEDLAARDVLSVLVALRGAPAHGRSSLEYGETLGEGGMGVVRLARQVSVGRTVAVKTLRAEHRSEAATLRLLREAWVTGALEHPNVAPVYDVKLDADGAPVIVLKRIEGVHWGELLGDEARVRERFRARDLLEWNLGILMHVCNAAHFAHSRGIVHRDLKPENVMIGEFGEVYLLDWGIAVSLHDDGTGRLPLARDARQIAGTPCYMAPECLGVDATPITARTDVYLLGAILYELITGSPPHPGATVLEIVASILSREPPFPPDAPAELVRICRRAMAIDPDGRFESAEQFRLALQGYLQHRGSAALAAQADAARASLRTELAAEGAATPARRQRVYDLFGACRFGFREALRIWPGNDAARASLREAAIAMVEFELADRDVRSARVLLGELEPPPPELVARVEALARELEAEARRARDLESLGRQFDATLGARTRGLLAMIVGASWVILPLVVALREGPRGSYPDLILGTILLGVVLGPLVWWARDSMSRSRINRSLVATSAATLAIQLVLYVGGLRLGLSPVTCGTLNMFLWGASATYLTVMLERRLAVAALGYFVAFFVACEHPAWRWYAMAASNALLTLAMARVWGSLALRVRREAATP